MARQGHGNLGQGACHFHVSTCGCQRSRPDQLEAPRLSPRRAYLQLSSHCMWHPISLPCTHLWVSKGPSRSARSTTLGTEMWQCPLSTVTSGSCPPSRLCRGAGVSALCVKVAGWMTHLDVRVVLRWDGIENWGQRLYRCTSGQGMSAHAVHRSHMLFDMEQLRLPRQMAGRTPQPRAGGRSCASGATAARGR